jgi:hypothetical protein
MVALVGPEPANSLLEAFRLPTELEEPRESLSRMVCIGGSEEVEFVDLGGIGGMSGRFGGVLAEGSVSLVELKLEVSRDEDVSLTSFAFVDTKELASLT